MHAKISVISLVVSQRRGPATDCSITLLRQGLMRRGVSAGDLYLSSFWRLSISPGYCCGALSESPNFKARSDRLSNCWKR